MLSYLVLLASFNNIFNPLFRRVGCFCLSLERQRDKNSYRRTRGKTERSEGWQGAGVGAVSAKMLLFFVFGAKAALRPRDCPSRGRTATTRAQRSGEKE